MSRWNEKNSSIAKTARDIITVKDILLSMGVEITDVCDTEQISEAVNKILKKWLDEVKRTIDNISFDLLGNFLSSVATLLAQIMNATAGAYTSLLMVDFLAGRIMNTILSGLTMIFASIPGAQIVFQYYLVSSLRRDLNRRIELGWILKNEISNLIQLLESFYTLFKVDTNLMYTDIKKALLDVKKAEALIGKEISKNFYGKEPVSINNIDTADNHLESAINHLTHKNYKIIYTHLKSINGTYGINSEPPRDFDVTGWINYFTAVRSDIISIFFTFNNAPGTPEYEREVESKQNLYRQYMNAIMKLMPPILQRLILNSLFKQSSNVIFERIPVWANNVKIIKDLKSYLDNTVTLNKDLMDLFGVTVNKKEPSLFKNKNTKDITWRNITSKIKIEEAGILLLPTYWDYIKNAGGLLKQILIPSLDILKNVDADMTNVLETKNLSLSEFPIKQFEWIQSINGARGILNSISGNKFISPITIYNSTVNSDVLFTKLQEFIKEKTYDSKLKLPKTEPSEIVYETAQKYLGNLVANIYIIVNPSAVKNVLSGLQSMRFAISQQISLDKKEVSLCTSFLNEVEKNPMFIMVKPYIDSLLNELSKTEIGSQIATQLLEGDLSNMITILEGHHIVEEIINVIDCANQNNADPTDTSILGLSGEIDKNTKIRVKQSINALKTKKDMAMNSISAILDINEGLV